MTVSRCYHFLIYLFTAGFLLAAFPGDVRSAEVSDSLLTNLLIAQDSLRNVERRIHFRLTSTPWSDELSVSDIRDHDWLYHWSLLKQSEFNPEQYFARFFQGEPTREQLGEVPSPERYIDYLQLFLHEEFDPVKELKGDSPDSLLEACDLLALGKYALRLHQYDEAVEWYSRAYDTALHPLLRTEACIGLASAEYGNGDYTSALAILDREIRRGGINDDLCFWAGKIMIRLADIEQAIELFHHTLQLNPKHENAHYYLGNGYSSLNYTQFKEHLPQAFPDSSSEEYWENVEEILGTVSTEESIPILLETHDQFPDWYEPITRLASAYWEIGDYPRAEEYAKLGCTLYPDAGRSHAIYAKILEKKRMQASRYYQPDDVEFAEKEMPAIPGIEQYVLNWSRLSERHRKQVAICIAPWREFIPVLATTGHSLYIKPLYEILSDSPGLSSMRDQRINLDSRLWDDVRGVGGYRTVTGIEDLERSIFHGYNTVLHELTHQVHGILTEAEKDSIEALYQSALQDERSGIPRFMSRYQGATVWEYFAEGVNGYNSPRRNEDDPREITRERLQELDPSLFDYVASFSGHKAGAEYLYQGWLATVGHYLEAGDVAHADSAVSQIDTSSGFSVEYATLQVKIALILGELERAENCAVTSLQKYPGDPESILAAALVKEQSRQDEVTIARFLEEQTAGVDSTKQHLLFNEIGRLYWLTGNYSSAIDAYDKTLSLHPDDPEALAGLAICYGDSSVVSGYGDKLYRNSLELFNRLLERRSGVLRYRLSSARISLLNNNLPMAEKQLKEAELLAPGHPEVLAMKGWVALLSGNEQRAVSLMKKCAESHPVPLIARFLATKYFLEDLETISPLNLNLKEPLRWRFDPYLEGYTLYGEIPYWMKRALQQQ